VIFEFQSMIAELTGCDVANASMYDGATAMVEAALLARSSTGRKRVVVVGHGASPLPGGAAHLSSIRRGAGDRRHRRAGGRRGRARRALSGGRVRDLPAAELLRPGSRIRAR
jgi:hypothetical protein